MLTSASGTTVSRKDSKSYYSMHRDFSDDSLESSMTSATVTKAGMDRRFSYDIAVADDDREPTPKPLRTNSSKKRPGVFGLFPGTGFSKREPEVAAPATEADDYVSMSAVSEAGETTYTDGETDVATVIERATNEAVNDAEMEKLVGFLTEVDYGFTLLLDRVKQNMHSCKEAVNFLKKRAAIEEEYGKQMLKLAQTSADNLEKNDSKQGTYAESWIRNLKIHEVIGQNHLKFSQSIQELAEQLNTVHKDTERSRRQLKDAGMKHARMLQDAETALEKSKHRYESSSEDWERAILQKEQFLTGDGWSTVRKGGLVKSMSNPMTLFRKTDNPVRLDRNEDEARRKTALANESYRVQLSTTNSIRQEYIETHLPRILRSLKETNDESDQALKYHLCKYAFDYENAMMSDATTLSPLSDRELGLRKILDCIDDKKDFQDYLTSYCPKRSTDVTIAELNAAGGINKVVPMFGLDLAACIQREDTEVPSVVTKCVNVIEEFGLRQVGIYRLSGKSDAVNRLRTAFDKDPDNVNLRSEEWLTDVNNITGVLKLYFRELPDPLFPKDMYLDFIEAAKIPDERLRVITIHDLINKLPDANYSTIKFLMGHLTRIHGAQHFNKMGISNLAIAWGPTLLGGGDMSDPVQDLQLQVRVIECVLTNFYVIFDSE